MIARVSFLALGAGALAAAFLATPVAAQSILQSQGQVVAATDDTLPGLPGHMFTDFDSPVLADDGSVLFRARFLGTTTTPTTDRAFFHGRSRSDLTMILRSGDPEPTGLVPGATLNSSSSSGISSSQRISGDGMPFFGARFDDGGVTITSANDTALYFGTPGSFRLLAREGDLAPGTVGATYSSSFSSLSQQQTSFNSNGWYLFKSKLAGGDVVGTTNDEAWFTGVWPGVFIAVRKGDLGPGGEVLERISPAFISQMNAVNDVLHDVRYAVGTGTVPVTDADDRALWIYTPGVGNQEVVREGDPTPIPGVNFGNASNSWSVSTGANTFNILGQTSIRSDLTGSVTAGVDDSAIFLVSLAGHSLVARRGDAAPDVPGAFLEVFNNSSQQLNDSGTVAFQCSLSGAGVTTANDTGIWAGMPGSLRLVAREGDVAPGTGGGTFGSTSGQSMMMNAAGQLLFKNTLAGGTSPGSSLWSWDPALGLRAAALFGDSIELQSGVFETVTYASGVQFGNGDSRPLSFANDGTFVTKVGLSNSKRAIMKGRIGSLTGVPSEMSFSQGGVQKLDLHAGAANGGFVYLVMGSFSGTAPGFSFGSVLVPLNPDAFLFFTISQANVGPFGNTFGSLSPEGIGAATITVPSGTVGALGATINWAYLVFDPTFNAVFASEPAPLAVIG